MFIHVTFISDLDSELNLSNEPQAPLLSSRKQHPHISQNLYLQHGDHSRCDSVEPQSPNITSWFLQVKVKSSALIIEVGGGERGGSLEMCELIRNNIVFVVMEE